MAHHTHPAASCQPPVERWGRRYKGLAITLSVVIGAVGGYVGLFVGYILGLALRLLLGSGGAGTIVLLAVTLTVAVACWILTSIATYRGLSGPRR